MALDSIIRHKRAELELRKEITPLEQIRGGLKRSDRSLAAALGGKRTGFVLECKRSSPSRGVIRRKYDPAGLALGLAAHADAISVLTDQRFFGGSLDDLRSVRSKVPCPVLRKDFILEPYQVYESRAYGADAVLLIMAALDNSQAAACMEAASDLGMDALVEVHDEEELRRALALGARMVGINSRNLKTLKVDLNTVERLAPLVPDDITLVAESGVRSHTDVRRFSAMVDAFLVGTAIMERDDAVQAAREIIYGRVKVCGLTSVEDAQAARNCGATFGGMIFADESPRRIDMKLAEDIASGVDLNWVGVFADADAAFVAEAARRFHLHAVQFHGDETDDFIANLKGTLPKSCEVWKAHRVRDDLPSIEGGAADKILLDTFVQGAKGGTGQSFDWSLLAGHDLSRVILSGGLGPGNALEADGLGAYALDVNSGVESAPGRKDGNLMDEFFSNLRGGGRRVKR